MEQGQIKFILIDGLGKSFIDKTVSDQGSFLWEFTPSAGNLSWKIKQLQTTMIFH